MAVLSDIRILAAIYDKKIEISPFIYEHIQPSSVDLTLDNVFKIPKQNNKISLDKLDSLKKQENYFEEIKNDKYSLKPNEFIIGQIRETISLPNSLTGTIQNRNSLIRLGIDVGLSTYINPGYKGKLPIVIKNISNIEIELISNIRICQLVLSDVTPSALKDYSRREDAKYQGEIDITLSKLAEDVEFKEYFEKNSDEKNAINDFFKKRLKNLKFDFDQLTDEEKKKIGLLK